MKELLFIFPTSIKNALSSVWTDDIEEIRLKLDKPIIIKGNGFERFLRTSNGLVFAGRNDIDEILCLCSDHSMYLKEDEINCGYLTIKGGHRIGLCGSVSYSGDKIIHHGDITSLNVRIAKEVIGCSTNLIPGIIEDNRVLSTLIISPPKKGKTTVLRDIARELSDSHKKRVGIVDERNELWGNGRYNIGLRSDVLSGCKKSDGIMMLVRTMAPDVIIVDELGGEKDKSAILQADTCGVSIIASIHGDSIDDIKHKGITQSFKRFVFLQGHNKFQIYKGDEIK